MKSTINYLLISVLLLAASACSGGGSTSDLKTYGLKGKVKSVVETTYDGEIKFENVEQGKKLRHAKHTFDKSGRYTQIDCFDKKGDFYLRYIPARDEKGNLLSEGMYSGKGELFATLSVNKVSDNLIEYEMSDGPSGGLHVEISMELEKGLITRKVEKTTVGDKVENEYVYSDYVCDGIMVQSYKKVDENESEAFRNVIEYENTYLEFDSKGNWTRVLKNEIENGFDSFTITTRRIEYY